MKKNIYLLFLWLGLTIVASPLSAGYALPSRSLAEYQKQKSSLPRVKQSSAEPSTVKKTIDAAAQKLSAIVPEARALTQRATQGKPIIKSIMDAMTATKKFMSPRQWGAIMSQFIGSLFLKFWHSVWHIVSEGLVTIVGPEKVYEIHNDGTIKTDRSGRKLPRLIPQFSLNSEGESVKSLVPTKWYTVLEDENSLLGLLVTSGIDGSIAATFKSLDRLFFRPIASTVLDIPLWKLSHVHYQLAMTELQQPATAMVNPKALTEKILSCKDPGLILTATSLPFNLRAIMSTKDNKEKMLITAITQHLWSIYQPIWQEIESTITVQGTNKKIDSDLATQSATQFSGTTLSSAKQLGDKIVDEASYIASESIKAKLLEGPVAPYLVYAQFALKIPEVIFGAQFNTQPTTELIGNDGNALSPDLTQKLLIAIDICDALASKARSKNIENNNAEDLTETVIVYHKANEKTVYKVAIKKQLLGQLLERQERGLRDYLPFCSHFAGESYDNYIMKLLMPRMIVKFVPKELKEALGIESYADASACIDIIKNKFNTTFKTLAAMSSLMAMIKKFEGTQSFAGRYVEIADTFDRCIQDLSALVQNVYPSPTANWQKQITSLARRSVLGRLSPDDIIAKKIPHIWIFAKQANAFNTTQKSRLKIAAQKSGHSNPILFFTKETVLDYINDASDITDQFTATQGKITQAIRRQRSNQPANEFETFTPLTYYDLLNMLDRWYNRSASEITTDRQDAVAVAKTLDRAYKLIIHTFGLLSLHHAAKVDAFFNAGTETTQKSTEALKKDYGKFERKINDNIALVIGHAQEFVSVLHHFYTDYGLREIIGALDEHYRVTGQKGKDIPLKVFARIALREGSAHLVGYGADKLLKGALNRFILPKISALQSSGLVGGNVINQMINQKLQMFIGNVNGRTNAYHATRSLIKNIFDYGASTALDPSNMMQSVGRKFIPQEFGGGPNEHAELMAHAEMARASGRAPSPLIAQKLKKMGIDPNNLPKKENPLDMSGLDSFADFDEEAFLKKFSR